MQNKTSMELFLYKNQLNTKSLVELLPKLSSKTINMIYNDLVNTGMTIKKETDDNVYIFTDGGCSNNGKKNAKGAYAVFFDQYSELNEKKTIVSEPTNQKAELLAIQKAMEIVIDNKNKFSNKNVIFVTDSMYAINCIEKWSVNWVKNDWKNSKGEQVKNMDIIKNIINLKKELVEWCSFKFKHQLSHTIQPTDTSTLEYLLWYGNDMVDKMVSELR
jgi:ribonuclease HI